MSLSLDVAVLAYLFDFGQLLEDKQEDLRWDGLSNKIQNLFGLSADCDGIGKLFDSFLNVSCGYQRK